MESLESESIEIIREAAATAQRPAILWSEGKDSAVLLHLARKSFYPQPPPFILLSLDWGELDPGLAAYRAHQLAEGAIRLDLHELTSVNTPAQRRPDPKALFDALAQQGIDLILCGLRGEEGRHPEVGQVLTRLAAHQTAPPDPRPAPWGLYNTHRRPDEVLQVFPLAHWTELDVWCYIASEGIPIAPLYLAAERWVRPVGSGWVLAEAPYSTPGDALERRWVRVPTLSSRPLVAIDSRAETLEMLIAELLEAHVRQPPATRPQTQPQATEWGGVA